MSISWLLEVQLWHKGSTFNKQTSSIEERQLSSFCDPWGLSEGKESNQAGLSLERQFHCPEEADLLLWAHSSWYLSVSSAHWTGNSRDSEIKITHETRPLTSPHCCIPWSLLSLPLPNHSCRCCYLRWVDNERVFSVLQRKFLIWLNRLLSLGKLSMDWRKRRSKLSKKSVTFKQP